MTLSYNHVYSCNQWVVVISEAEYILIFMMHCVFFKLNEHLNFQTDFTNA